MKKQISIILLLSLFFFYQSVAAEDENLINNPGFERKGEHWSGAGKGYVVKENPTSKSMSLYLSTIQQHGHKEIGNKLAGASQSVVIHDNARSLTRSIVSVSAHTIAEDVAAGEGSYMVEITIVDVQGGRTVSQKHIDHPSTTEWTFVEIQQIVSSIASIEVSLILSNEGAVWFDDVSVTLKPYEVHPTIYTTEQDEKEAEGHRSVRSYEAMDEMASTYADATYTLGMKYVILAAAADDIRLEVIVQTLDSVGALYDTIYPSTLNNGSLGLTNTDGSGKYFAVILCTDTSGATAYQLQEVENYQIKFGVKKLVFYSIPNPTTDGTTVATKGPNSAVATLTFAPNASSWISGYNTAAALPLSEVWNYPTTITNASLATAAMYVNYAGDSTKYVVASFVKTPVSGTRSLKFYCDQATWAPHSVALASFWLQWVSNNMYIGLRRIYLNLHLDDLFMASNTWDVINNNSSETETYRITPNELKNTATNMDKTNKALFAGSNISISFPFNGLGVEEAGGTEVDPLFKMAKTLLNSFVWEQHTYNHPELNNLTYAESKKELTDNIAFAFKLFGSYNHARYANNSMVTPSISGIFNGGALKALWDVGIRHIVGDNSRPELNPPFWYRGWYTNVTKNGFAGMHVVPREATYIYYDCSNAQEEEGEYNHLYRSFYGKDSTLADIVGREGKRVTQLLLAFRNEAYMFHQANLREFTYNGATTTLVKSWLDAVLAEYKKYLVLPIHGHNSALLMQKYTNREARDACGFSAKLTVNAVSKQITAIQGSSTGNCDIALTGIQASATQTKLSTETYGPDVTTWVNMRKDSFSFTLKTPVSL